MGFATAAKARKLANALERSKTSVRETSSSSTDNSQLTSAPPTVYRLGKLNIPGDLAGMTKLVQSEFQKIEQSQSVILSIAQKVQSMIPHPDSLEFKLPVTFDSTADFKGVVSIEGGIANTPEVEGEVGWNLIPSKPQAGGSDFDSLPWGLCSLARPASNAPEGWNGYGDCFTLPLQGTHGFKTIADYIAGMTTGNAWIVQFALDTSGTIAIRTLVNALPWKPWVKLTTAADEVALAKAEIYAELARLNPGIVIPQQ